MKRVTALVLLSGLTALLTLGLSGCGSSTQPISVALTPGSAQSMDQGQTVAITAAVAHDAKSGGVTWNVSGGGTLSGSTATSATYNAPASVTSAVTATVTATAVTDTTRTATLQIKVNPLPVITTTSFTVAAGTAYSGTLSASGGTSPYTWAITAGSLPPGLSLNTSTGAITGTPTGGSGSATFQVTDSSVAGKMPSAPQAVTITVNPPPALTITTTSLPNLTIGTAYNQTLQAAGGVPSYKWSLASGSSLPAGLTLSSAGVISGTPTGTFTGTTTFSVTVTDSQTPSNATTTAKLSISVNVTKLSVTTTSLAGGSIGTPYSQTLAATGGITPYTWAVTVGALPQGLILNAATGVISGTPSGTFVGTDTFTVTVTDAETPTPQMANAVLSITISVAPLSVTTTSGSLPTGVVNSVYPSTTLQATGGITPYTWSYTGTLPPGLTLSGAGVISGKPTTAGTFSFTVTVTDSETPTQQKANASLSITVNPQLSVTTTSLPAGVIGTAYSQTLAATGGITPYTWAVTVGSLPAGLSLNPNTGVISGTPSGNVTGTTTFTVTVTDSESPTKISASAILSITITAPTLKVTTTSLPGGSIGTPYPSQTLAATGGITPYTWAVTVGALPQGLILNAATGVISGTPTGTFVGTDTFTVTVTDTETPTPQMANAVLSITISVAPLSVTTTSGSLPTGVVSSVYPSTTLQATGGITPYTWSYTGTLPPGLALSGAGVISGKPTTAGTFNFTVTVTDSETPNPQKANASLSITVNAQLSVTTTSLPAGVIGTAYSQTLAGTGGITPYTWTLASGSSLPSGLSLSPSGAITGTPTGPFVGVTTFTVQVTDSESPQVTASASLSITISAPTLKVTTTSLPNGVIGNSYSATVNATGGVQPYTWSLSGNPAWLSINPSTGVLSGTPTATGTFSFTVKVTDAETPTAQTASANLSISVNNSAPLMVTTSGLPTGVVNTPYQNAMLQASGGVQPYTWSISAGSLPAGLKLSSAGCGSDVNCAITGTPTATGTTSFTVKVTDSTQPNPTSATANLSITINGALTITTTSVPNGSLNALYSATINASGGLQPYSWSIISGSLPPGLTPNSSNSLNISGTPTTTGSYTFTVQVTDNENPQVSVSNSYTIVINNQPVGYTVSGTVSYSGSKTGWVYLQLNSNNCGGCNNNLGTSTKAGSAFTIHGVLPGTYNLQAFLDNLGYGAENASNPTGNVGNITVVNANVSGVSITLTDPGAVTLSSGPTWAANKGSGAFNGGAFISFQSIKNNNIEMPASYTVQWSTSSSFNAIAGSKSFPATGKNNPWIVNGLTNGTTYFFRAQGVAGSSTSNWSAASPGITIGAPTGGNTVSGAVTFTGTAKGPLYVGFYDQNTGNVYADVVGSQANPPKSPAAYTVQVPNGSNYYFFGLVDQNNSGLIGGPGQISNTNEDSNASVAINGPLSNENLTLPSANSFAIVRTQNSEQINQGVTSDYYSIGFNINGLFKLPVAVELVTGPNPGVVMPADIANNAFNGSADKFSFWASLNGATPKVGDSYTLNVTYSDGTSEVLTVTVGAVLNAFATNLVPQGNGVSVTPNFSWTDPAGASNYLYQFGLWDSNGNQIWQIPGNNSNSNGFSSSITSITWGVDPTGSGDLPSVSSLNGSSTYYWQITAYDTNGDSAQVQVNFQTVATPLTLPPAGSVGSVVVGQNFSGAINASGGVGPNYSFTVNGATVPTDGTQVSLGDNLFAWNTGGNTLSLGGTPNSIQTVSFTVSVMDSGGNTAGPFTYTITVTSTSPLTIETPSLPGGNNGWFYSTNLKASGGVQPYTWSVISGSLPGGLNIGSSSGNNGIIFGMPNTTGTANFTVQVTDNVGATASQALSIAITNCTFAALNGNYAFLLDGWKSGTDIQATVGSFVANGAGTITSGEIDINDQTKGPQNVTITGTYCVSSNNLALVNIIASGKSGSATFAAALDSTGNGHIVRYDNTSSEVSSGLLRKQTTSAFSTSKFIGNYAFGFVGADGGSDNRFAMAGEFTSSTGSGGNNNLSGEVDYDSGGSGQGSGPGNTTLNASNFQVGSSTTGRGTVSISFTGPGATLNFVFYVVNASELLFMDDDGSGSQVPLVAGQVLQQSGSFTDASLNGVSVLESEALDANNTPATVDVQAGLFTADGNGSFSVSMDDNDGGTVSSQTDSGTYSVTSNGRMTLSSSGGGHSPVFYLIAKNQAFGIGTNPNKVSLGTLTPQTGSNFNNASFSGNYLGGSLQPVTYNASSEVDAVNANGAGTFNVTTDQNNSNCGSGSGCPNSNTISGLNYSVSSNGRAIVTCGSGSGGNCSPAGTQVGIIYIISTSQAVFLPTQDSSPTLSDFHQ